MLTVYSEEHKRRDARIEISDGKIVDPYECPARAEVILDTIQRRNLGKVISPSDFGLDPVRAIHDGAYLDFLATCWNEWEKAGYGGEPIAISWPSRSMNSRHIPREIEGKVGYYALGSETTVSEGTWEAAQAGANVALTATQHVLDGAGAAFGLCRPPGHHATQDQFGGYCFLNNAAIAAQHALDQGKTRVAILDVDFHHGNGTQHIFYPREDVFFLSLHGDPLDTFPYFLGHAEETGEGAGAGFTANYPMPPGTGFDPWAQNLQVALARIDSYAPDLLIISLGVDTYQDDPISTFKLDHDDFFAMGRHIGALNLPTAYLMEGGYAVDAIGINTTNVLFGHEDAAKSMDAGTI